MAWSVGSELLMGIISQKSFQSLGHKAKVALCLDLIQLFEGSDCDTVHEVYGLIDEAFDDAFRALYPGEAEELDEAHGYDEDLDDVEDIIEENEDE